MRDAYLNRLRLLCVSLLALAAFPTGHAFATPHEVAAPSDNSTFVVDETADSQAGLDGASAGPTPDSRDHERGGIIADLTYEYHRLIRQNDLAGDAVDRNVNFFIGTLGYDITRYDRVYVELAAYERFLADQGESGLRADDAILAYSRFIPLANDMELRVTGRLTAPLSFESKLGHVITTPRLTVRFDKLFRGGPANGLLLTALGYGEVNIVRSATSDGGAANERFRFAALLGGEYSMPFLPRLSVGVNVFVATIGLYSAGGSLAQTGIASATGGIANPVSSDNLPNQPLQAEFGAELFVRYHLGALLAGRALSRVRFDLLAAYANGDPVLGYQNELHDGVTRVDALFYRHTSEVYFALSARY